MRADPSQVPVFVLCGVLGTRLMAETEVRPKPMVPVGNHPILWHIMQSYARHGFKKFVLCLGYKGEGIKEIAEAGPVFDGKVYELDLLIYATGFEVQQTGIYNEIRGKNGIELNDKYKDGIRTVLGIHSHGYPNLFIMGGYQATFRFNLTDVLQTQGDHIAACIDHARRNGHHSMDPTPEIEEWWVQEVIANRGKTTRAADCTPGYYNFEGQFLCDLSQGKCDLTVKNVAKAPPTATPAPPTATSVPPTATDVPPTPTATPVPVLLGDVNGDGTITSIDALLLLQFGANLLDALVNIDAADVNADGVINAVDTALILQYIAGLLASLAA